MPPRLDVKHTHRWFDSPRYDPTTCRVRVWDMDEGLPLVLISQPPESTGTSIANAMEQIAAAILVHYLPERIGKRPPFLLVQHYPLGGPNLGAEALGEDFARVTFSDYSLRGRREGPLWRRRWVGPLTLGGDPVWHHRMPLAAIEALIGEALTEERVERDMPLRRKLILQDERFRPRRRRENQGNAE